MVNYQLGKIYTVRSLTSPEIYVGSTVAPLCKRMTKHRSDWKNGLVLGKNKLIVENIEDWYIELYELFPCNLKCELEKREGKIIREIGTLNKNIAGRTKKEYYIDNADKLKEEIKQYRSENKEKAKQYRADHKEEIKQYDKQYRAENKEKAKQYRAENKEKAKQYYTDHKEEAKQKKKTILY